jgi:hypothetical protein
MSPDEKEDFALSITSNGLLESDFTTEEVDLTDYSNMKSVEKGTIEITYVPTGATKTYETGHCSSWSAEFDDDLKAGFYTKA